MTYQLPCIHPIMVNHLDIVVGFSAPKT